MIIEFLYNSKQSTVRRKDYEIYPFIDLASNPEFHCLVELFSADLTL